MLVRIVKFVRREKFVLMVMVATILTFSIVSLFSYQVTHWFQLWYFNVRVGQVQSDLEADLQYVFRSMGDVAVSSRIANLIEAKNVAEISSALHDVQAGYGLDAMTVTDGEGVVLARTQVASRSQDYIFQTTPYGLKIAEETPVVSIERGSNIPLIMIAGYPVTDHGTMVGAVFGGYSIDDAYAHAFRNRYLTAGENLIFYSDQNGMVGTTFEASSTRSLLAAYFDTGSDWIQKGESNREVMIEGKVYVVKNIVFPGLYGSPGGVLVLYPAGYTTEAALFSLIVALIFAFIVFYAHTRRESRKRHITEVTILIICSLIVFLVTFFIDQAQLYNHSIPVENPPYTIYNSTLAFNPIFAVWDESSEQQVAVEVSTGGESINAVEADVIYDPAEIHVADIITADSFCSPDMYLEKSIDNERGEVRVVCGLPSPGFSGQDGNVMTLDLRPVQMGAVVLHFATDTQVLANDGLGTDVLRLATDGSYRIVDESTVENGTSSVLVFSPTYPNSAQWYNEPNGLFTWVIHPGYNYSYALDHEPTVSTLVGASTTSADSVSLSGLTDGIYYFHIQPTKDGVFGDISNYKVMIDTTLPSKPVIKASATTVTEGQVIRLTFESEDKTSGLQSSYYIQLDDGVFLPAASPLFISLPGRRAGHGLTSKISHSRNSNLRIRPCAVG